ncbi:MAG: prenyltransferase/squalene oxidase repeat-containing protein [Phycisphaerales bacterium]
MRNTVIVFFAALALFACLPQPARAIDTVHDATARAAIQQGVAYPKSTHPATAAGHPSPARHHRHGRHLDDQLGLVPTDDPQIEKALAYILSNVQEDGGIHAGILDNYNTSICLTALDLFRDRPGMEQTIKNAQDYLRGLQWDGQTGPDGKVVDESHPFYGGAGYGNHGRPDMSNTQFMLQGLYDSGLDCKDPAFTRAIVFISRCQGIDSNELLGGLIEKDGGFIYSTSINKDLIGVPESKANPDQMDEAEKGQPVSGLRTYGSMTYAGFKSYLYAQLDRNDPRVVAALGWIGRNYTLDKNPGLPEALNQQGLYYYYMTFARTLDAYGETTLLTADGVHHDWANDLVDAVASRQKPDGSWTNDADRWMEGDPNLVTCYSLIALEAAAE